MRTLASLRDRGVPARPDAGFTLIEMLMALAVIGIVMSALAVFFTNSMTFTGQQRSEQVAIQLAGDGIERARALKGSSLRAGRGRTSSENQWHEIESKAGEGGDRVAKEVFSHLRSMKIEWDPMLESAPTAGEKAPLPTAPDVVTVNGVEYTRNWYVGRCRQQAVSASTQNQVCDKPGPTPVPRTFRSSASWSR
nr:hypothetical protein GCM10020093_074230 [Planobispora longispora]